MQIRIIIPLICVGVACVSPGWGWAAEARQGLIPLDAPALARFIDQVIDGRLRAEQVQPAPAADDAEFLRRVYLDLHGVIPPAQRVAAFLDSTDPDKRAQLVDELLASPRYGEHLADIWDDFLFPSGANQRIPREPLTRWLADSFNRLTWDRLATAVLTATGPQSQNGAVSYLLRGRETVSVTELTDIVSRYFLGVQMNCAQCHDHPFTDFTRQDYWGLAAFFTQVQRQERFAFNDIVDNPRVNLSRLEDYENLKGVTPRFLKGQTLDPASELTYRQAFARWLTAPENPYFARAMVNRMWGQLFGRGLVHPVDDMHDGNPTSHPELLDELSRQFVAHDYDLKYLLRAICGSQAYQRSSRPAGNNATDQHLFSRMYVKVLTPEQMYDSLVAVFGPPARLPGGNARLGQRDEFIEAFRVDGELEPTRYDRGIPQMLRMMNSPQFLGLRREPAFLAEITASKSSAAAVEALYLRILARRPTAEERALMSDYIQQHPGGGNVHAEIAWALVNSSEFSLNH